MHPGEAHLTVAVVDWTTPYKRRRRGLCSSYLASTSPMPQPPTTSEAKEVHASSGDSGEVVGGHSDSSCRHCVAVWVEMGSLRMPRLPAVPLLLIGPGTGVAPFRAFLEERQAMSEVQAEAAAAKLHWPQLGPCSDADNKEGPLEAVDPAMSSSAVAVPQQLDGPAVPPLPPLPPPLAACCLFVGCRSAQADCYYLEQWQALQAAGVLVRQAHGLSIAASRDQPQKVGDDDMPGLDGGELVPRHHSTGAPLP